MGIKGSDAQIDRKGGKSRRNFSPQIQTGIRQQAKRVQRRCARRIQHLDGIIDGSLSAQAAASVVQGGTIRRGDQVAIV